jgi:hypothetical protein
MEFWDRIQKDIGKNLKEGLRTIKDKAGELSEEGKRKYKIYDLQSQIHKLMAELGASVYALKDSGKNPVRTPKVSALLGKISKLEERLTDIEPSRLSIKPVKKGTKKKSTKKTTKNTSSKKTVKKK